MEQVKRAAIKALIYADIFNYPLTSEQIWEYAVASHSFSHQQLVAVLPLLQKIIDKKGDFYFLSGRNQLVDLRSKRGESSKEKMLKAQRVSQFLSVIPTINFIGVSGSVTMGNADKEDDVDLFFITLPGCVWITRLFVGIFLGALRVRRKKHAKEVSDLICANMFVSRDAIIIPKSQHNLYTAHEIVQTIPLFSVNNAYEQFIHNNRWIHIYLPNWKKKNINSFTQTTLREIFATILSWTEPLVRFLQILYMRKSRTSETVTENVIAFYPSDRYKTVMAKFARGCKIYDL
ncbi:MAG: hypothetical protein KGJ07_08140 [Patescibacteria group bacterium]|nr:hypothetical protein [Patescibacteria group bacterium]MDE2590879.1 hypothetical protein [Patescibacteria group bacterium]